MKPLTKLQIEELLPLIEIRRETVEEDPLSGDAFELTPGALDTLEGKLNAGAADYTPEEVAWMVKELNEQISKCEASSGDVDLTPAKQRAYINSMQNAIDKLTNS